MGMGEKMSGDVWSEEVSGRVSFEYVGCKEARLIVRTANLSYESCCLCCPATTNAPAVSGW